MKKYVIYTAFTKGYDSIKDPLVITKNCDYICFTDSPSVNSTIWKVRPFPKSNLDNVRKCRQMKITPHIFLSEYQYSIWVDANILINDDLTKECNRYFVNSDKDMYTFKHPKRDCIYDEGKAYQILKLDNPQLVKKQMSFYKSNKYPTHKGLVESNVIFRKHNSAKIIPVMDEWWVLIKKYSRRDQLSFNYAAWKHNFEYGLLENDSHNNHYFISTTHKTNNYTGIKSTYMKIKKLLLTKIYRL